MSYGIRLKDSFSEGWGIGRLFAFARFGGRESHLSFPTPNLPAPDLPNDESREVITRIPYHSRFRLYFSFEDAPSPGPDHSRCGGPKAYLSRDFDQEAIFLQVAIYLVAKPGQLSFVLSGDACDQCCVHIPPGSTWVEFFQDRCGCLLYYLCLLRWEVFAPASGYGFTVELSRSLLIVRDVFPGVLLYYLG